MVTDSSDSVLEDARGHPGDGQRAARDHAARAGSADAPVALPSDVAVADMDLVGGELALDFVNTGSHRATAPFREKLGGYGDLVTFGERVGALTAETAEKLRALAAREPEHAELVLTRARALREAIYRAFTSMNRGDVASQSDLAIIGAEAALASAHRLLIPTPEGCEWEYGDDEALERPLWPVALNAADLATSGDVSRVKECASDDCNWLFLDSSKNRSRRWCDMKDCGNRAKARRHRARASS